MHLAFERLDAASRRPIAVALSGGGDSLSALIATVAWAKAAGRPVIALSVDHRLNPDSARWTAEAGEQAARLGCGFQPLSWQDDKPATGLAAAARQARHSLLAEAARAVGARVIVTGHTADDALENAWLGQGALADWSPSPIWPQGRELFLLRPLLGHRRADLRRRLTAEGWSWVDDPANDNPAHPRARARKAVAGASATHVRPPQAAALARLWTAAHGAFSIDRARFAAASESEQRLTLSSALTVAGGAAGPPRAPSVTRLHERLQAGESFASTLRGARLIAGPSEIAVVRDAGERARGGLTPAMIGGGIVWDGRYAISSDAPAQMVCALAGQMARLDERSRARIAMIPAPARPSLPVFIQQEGSCPILAEESDAWLRWLGPGRFLGACGAIAQEADL